MKILQWWENLTQKIQKSYQDFLILKYREMRAANNTLEHQKRKEDVQHIFFQILPKIDGFWAGRPMLVVEKANYFALSDNRLISIDVFIPDLPLFVVVGDVSTASWAVAEDRGLSREEWEAGQADKTIYNREGDNLGGKPTLLYISWDDPINVPSIMARLEELRAKWNII